MLALCSMGAYRGPATGPMRLVVALYLSVCSCGGSHCALLVICAGESTKKASDAGYIGNKGIGFKSVFKLSAQPRVHSRQYHLQFDSGGDGLGYIVPTPVAAPEGWDESSGTAVVLPLASSDASETLRGFRVHMGQIRPSLLLFLHRLQQLELHDVVGRWARTLCRYPDPNDEYVVVLQEAEAPLDGASDDIAPGVPPTARCSRWLMMRQTLRTKVNRLGIEHTEVALAFPLDSEVSPLPPLEVCAFLPLRTYGLRFLLQADFVVPSSRESVDASSEWNQWLRSEVPALFLRAAEEFLRRAAELAGHSDLDGCVDLVNLLLECCPLPGQVMDFFAPIGPMCCRHLRSCRCIPTREGALVRPADAVMLSALEAGLAAEGIDPEALLRQLDLHIAHARLRLPPALVKELGLLSVDASLLSKVLQQLSPQWSTTADVDYSWLTWVFHELQRDPTLNTHMATLRRLPLVPLASGKMASVEQGAIYEVDDALAKELHAAGRNITALRDLRLLDPNYVIQVERTRPAARVMLGRLRVEPLERQALVEQHVIPLLAPGGTQRSELPHVLAFVLAQQAHCSALGNGLLENRLLAMRARVLATDGGVVEVGSPDADAGMLQRLHLGPQLRLCCLGPGAIDFVPRPPPEGFREVDEAAYLAIDGDAQKWIRLFAGLGIDWFPVATPARAPALDDWQSPALDAVLRTLTEAEDSLRLIQLLAVLSNLWMRRDGRSWGLREQCVIGQRSPENLFINESLPITTLLRTLRSTAWVPGTDSKLHLPADLWLNTPENDASLGDAVPYVLLTEPPIPLEMARTLGLNMAPTPHKLLSLLRTWSTGPLYSTLPRMATVLKIVCSCAVDDEVFQEQLLSLPFIWLPNASARSIRGASVDVRCCGTFFTLSQCVWNDPSKLLDPTHNNVSEEVGGIVMKCGVRRLAPFYVGRHVEDFLTRLGLQRYPSTRQYVAILRAAASAASPPNASSLVAVFRVFCQWGYADEWDKQLQEAQEQARERAIPRHRDRSEDGPMTQTSEDDAGDDADAAGTAGGDVGCSIQGLQLRLRKELTKELGDAAVFPTAAGTWQSLEHLLFVVPAPLDVRIERSAEVACWSDVVLSRCVEVRPPPSWKLAIGVASLEEALACFYSEVLGLKALSSCCREAVVASSHSDAEAVPAAEIAWLVAAAGGLQRFSHTYLPDASRTASAALFRGLRVCTVEELSVCVEARLPTGELLERAPGRACSAHIDAPRWSRQVEQGGAWLPDATSHPEGALLYISDLAEPDEALAHEMCRLLPPGLPSTALLVVIELCEQVWSAEEAMRPEELRELICGPGRARWQKLAPLSEGEALWLELVATAEEDDESTAAQAEATPTDMEEAMRREMQLLSIDAVAVDASAASGELDPVLQKAMEKYKSIEAARTAASGAASSSPAPCGLGHAPTCASTFKESGAPSAAATPAEGSASGPGAGGIRAAQTDGSPGAGRVDSGHVRERGDPLARETRGVDRGSDDGPEPGNGGDGGRNGGSGGACASTSGCCGSSDSRGGGAACGRGAASDRQSGSSSERCECSRSGDVKEGSSVGSDGVAAGTHSRDSGRGYVAADSLDTLDGFDFSERMAPRLAQEPRSDNVSIVRDWEPAALTPELLDAHNAEHPAPDTEASGRWGEQLAARVAESSSRFVSVKWVNEHEEAGLPYDIEAVEAMPPAAAGAAAPDTTVEQTQSERRVYIEVKTTTSQDRELFEVSPAEVDFMRRAGPAFEIHRIWGAGSQGVRIARLRHPAAHLAAGKLALLMSSGGAGLLSRD